MSKIVIVGAGAMGCLFGARLSLAGNQVTLVDVDRERLNTIATEGIHLHDHGGEHHVEVNASLAADVAGPVDLVLLFTKAMHSAAAIRSVAHLADRDCCALTLQNGLGNAETLAEVFSAERVLLGVTDWPADLTPPNRVDNHGEGHVSIGAHTYAGAPHAESFAAILDAAGMNCRHDPEIHAAVWEKAAFNASLNAMSTIIGQPVGALDCPEGRRLALALADEAIAIAAARDIAMDRGRLVDKIEFALAHHKGHKPSMLQDRLAGRGTEIDAINGEIVRAAEAVGLEAPVTATLADLVRMGDARRTV